MENTSFKVLSKMYLCVLTTSKPELQRNRFQTSSQPAGSRVKDTHSGNFRNTTVSDLLLFMTAVRVNYVCADKLDYHSLFLFT